MLVGHIMIDKIRKSATEPITEVLSFLSTLGISLKSLEDKVDRYLYAVYQGTILIA